MVMTIVDDSNVTANKPADPSPTQEESLLSLLSLLAIGNRSRGLGKLDI
jgi:hypothetical protein